MKSKYILRDEKVDLVDEAESALPSPMLAGDCSLSSLRYSVIERSSCHQEGRSDLAFPVLRSNKNERLPRCARLLVIARDEAISPFLSCDQTNKRDCHAALAMTKLRVATPRGCLDKIQERLPRCARNDSGLSSRGTKRSRLFERASQ